MFAVYSNTTAPASNAYMNAVYGSNGFPMLGTFSVRRNMSARSVVANGGALTRIAPAVGWAARIASDNSDIGYAVATDSSGNVFVTGTYVTALTLFNSSGVSNASLGASGGGDCFVAKYSPAGAVLWAARIASTSSDIGYGIATDSSGNVFVTGSYASTVTIFNSSGVSNASFATGNSDCFLVKYSAVGAVLWAARIAGAIEIGRAIATDTSGNVFVTGSYAQSTLTLYNSSGVSNAALARADTGNTNDCFIAKYSSAGGVLWAAQIGGTATDTGYGIATDSSGNVFVAGSYGAALTLFNSSGVSNASLPITGYVDVFDCFIAKYSSVGGVLWATRISGAYLNSVQQGTGIATDSSGNVFVTGFYLYDLILYNSSGASNASLPDSSTSSNGFVAKYSSAGEVLWAANIASVNPCSATGVATDLTGNVFVTGSYISGPIFYNSSGVSNASIVATGGGDCFVAKYSPAGGVLWATRITGTTTSVDKGNGIATDSSGNVFVIGQYTATLTFYNAGEETSGTTIVTTSGGDCFIAKYSPDGFIANAPTPASSNVLVSATYTPSTFSSFVNGFTQTTLAGTTLTTVGLFLGGPSNYFSGSISEVLVFGTTLTAAQRQSVEGYLSRKWGIGTALISTHPFYTIPPFNRYFNPTDVPGCSLWLDGIDGLGQSFVTTNSAVVTTLAGNGPNGAAANPRTDGTGTVARFNHPDGVVYNQFTGNIVVADMTNNAIRIVSSSTYGPNTGVVTTLTTGTTRPGSVGILLDGNIIVGSITDGTLKIVTPGGAISTLASGLGSVPGIAVLPDGNVVAVQQGSNRVIRVTYPGGVVTTLAGNGSGTSGSSDGTGTAASFFLPAGICVLPNGNLVIADYGNNRIRYITYPGGVVTTLAGSANNGFADGTGTGASFSTPAGVAALPDGSIAVINSGRNCVQVVRTSTYTLNSGVTTVIAGTTATQGSFSDGTGVAAGFWFPIGIASLPDGRIVVGDHWNHRIRIITRGVFTVWNDKSGLNNTMTGTATWTGSNMSFNGSTNAFSNTNYVFPISNYSMFAVYSNTTAPAASAYMNAVYGSNGFPMLGTFDVAKNVSARSVVANTGALAATPVGWVARIAGVTTSGETGYAIATDPSGNVFVTGTYQSILTIFDQAGTAITTLPYAGNNDCFVAKYSPAGAVLWAAQIAGTGTDTGYAIATDPSGNVFVTGSFSQGALTFYNQGPTGSGVVSIPFGGGEDFFVAKYSSAGAVMWVARFDIGNDDQGLGIATDVSGNVYVTGYYASPLTIYNQGPSGTAGTTLSNVGGSQDCFIAKYSPVGAVLWAARIAGVSVTNDQGIGIATDTSGNVIVTGLYLAAVTVYNQGPTGSGVVTLPFTGGVDGFVAKYSSAGAVLWAARITGTTTSSDQGNAVATDPSGNVFVIGQYTTAVTVYNQGPTGSGVVTLPFTAGVDCFVAKYSSAGAVLWAARIASTGTDIGRAIATDPSGNVFVTGYYTAAVTVYNQGPTGSGVVTLPTGGSFDCFVAKYSSAGAVLWATRISSAGQDIAYGIATDPSGNVLVTGFYGAALTLFNQGETVGTTLPFTGGSDCFIAKYSPDGFITAPVPASSNVLVSATYTPSTFSPFVNGFTASTRAGTTLATTGIFVGGPSNYFNGTISELLIYSANLSAAQRQQVEGYLIQKWGLSAQTLSNHQYKLIPPATSQPAQLDEVTPGNWTRDWQPYLRSLVAANASATPTYSVLTGTLAGYKIGFLAPNGNIYLPPHAVNQGCALITPTPTGATFSTTAITGVSTGQIYGNDWIGGAMYPDGMLYLIPYDASYNNTPGIANLDTNTNVFRSNPYTAGNTTNFNLQFMSGTMAPDGNMFILPYAVATGGAVSLRFFNPITKLMVAYSVNKPTAERFSAAILAPNGNIYGVAITGPAQACMINPIARTFTTIGSNATVQYRGLVYGGNGSIYMIPNANATGIGILNTTTNTITANAIAGGLGYYGGVLGPDGNIYCIPSTATNIGVINTRTNTFSTLGSVAANSYGSAVLAPNGNIYLIPFGASAIGMISFTGLNMLPSTSFCLSPYVNRGFFTQ